MLNRVLKRIHLFAIAAAIHGLPHDAGAQLDATGKELTRRVFVADTAAVEAGKPFRVGFHFTIADGW
ncbi:MAG: hypothetical protein ABMA01_21230, partial [Chthoniobacteraceae bacterium]